MANVNNISPYIHYQCIFLLSLSLSIHNSKFIHCFWYDVNCLSYKITYIYHYIKRGIKPQDPSAGRLEGLRKRVNHSG